MSGPKLRSRAASRANRLSRGTLGRGRAGVNGFRENLRPLSDVLRYDLLADDLHEHALASISVKFAVKDLLPRTEIELAVGDRDHDFASHNAALQVGIGVVFARAIVLVSRDRLVRRKSFEPLVEIAVQAGLVVV